MTDVTENRPRWHGVLERIAEARRGDSSESLAAVFMLGATVLALVWANSPWGATYDAFWHTHLAISFGGMPRRFDKARTTPPLLACGWVTSR